MVKCKSSRHVLKQRGVRVVVYHKKDNLKLVRLFMDHHRTPKLKKDYYLSE